MKRWIPFAIILAAGLLAILATERDKVSTRPSADAILSATGDAEKEITRIPADIEPLPPAEEIRIGDELARSYEATLKPPPEVKESAAKVEEYLQKVGGIVSAHARRKFPYQFHYIPEPKFVNAFALPGGHVFVGEGLIRLMHSEDALAAVLGHEVEHIDLGHCAERVQTEAQLRHLGSLGEVASLPVGVFTAGYSKQQELEADRYGTALATAAGYSPLGILQLLSEFESLEHQAESAPITPTSPGDEAAQVSLQTLEGYFQSHPPAVERKAQIESLIRSEHWPLPPLRPVLCSSELHKTAPTGGQRTKSGTD
ncbi:MAG: M48 family metalloprotease [Acidobacteriota bacterium]